MSAMFAINDLHGNLMPPTGGITILDPNDASKPERINVAAGGVEEMATLIKSSFVPAKGTASLSGRGRS